MVRRWSNATFLFCDDKPWKTEGWLVEGNGGIDMRTKLITEADIIEGGKYQRFMVWDENNNRLTYWDAEEGKWEGEMHKIPTTGSFIEHPLEGLVAPAGCPTRRCGATRPTPSSTPIGTRATRRARSRTRPACQEARAVPRRGGRYLEGRQDLPVPHRVGRLPRSDEPVHLGQGGGDHGVPARRPKRP